MQLSCLEMPLCEGTAGPRFQIAFKLARYGLVIKPYADSHLLGLAFSRMSTLPSVVL